MERTYTFGDFLRECENFEYSQEYYEGQKLLSEIELAESYMATQKYLKEDGMNIDLPDGILMEATEEAAEEAALGVGDKLDKRVRAIIGWIKKQWARFCAWIEKGWMKFIEWLNKIFGKEEVKKKAKAVADDAKKYPAKAQDQFNLILAEFMAPAKDSDIAKDEHGNYKLKIPKGAYSKLNSEVNGFSAFFNKEASGNQGWIQFEDGKAAVNGKNFAKLLQFINQVANGGAVEGISIEVFYKIGTNTIFDGDPKGMRLTIDGLLQAAKAVRDIYQTGRANKVMKNGTRRLPYTCVLAKFDKVNQQKIKEFNEINDWLKGIGNNDKLPAGPDSEALRALTEVQKYLAKMIATYMKGYQDSRTVTQLIQSFILNYRFEDGKFVQAS